MATASSSPFALTGDNAIDAITHGYYWRLVADRTIQWSLSRGLNQEVWNFPAETANALAQALSTFAYFANIKFEYIGYLASPYDAGIKSDLNFAGDGANVL